MDKDRTKQDEKKGLEKMMNRKARVWLALFAALALLCAGCGGTKAPPPADSAAGTEIAEENAAESQNAGDAAEIDYLSIYAPVLDETRGVLLYGIEDGRGYQYAASGILEMRSWMDADGLLSSVGYAITDVSGDGAPELLVGIIPDNTGEVEIKNSILGGYAWKDGEIVTFLDGWGRNGYQWMGGGRFYNSGSAGAMSSVFGVYQITPDGAELVCEDFYFTAEKDENYEEIVFYHNTTGLWDKDAPETLAISEDEFWHSVQAYADQCLPLEMTAFSEYPRTGTEGDEGHVSQTDTGEVRVDYAADVLSNLPYFEDVSADEVGIEEKVVFQSANGVQDFKVLALQLEDVDDEGHATFSTSVVYEQPELQAGVPLVVPMAFPGDIPNNGFSYVDSQGVTRRFTVSVSGFDGSLVTAPFD